jgi:hypothetical protein
MASRFTALPLSSGESFILETDHDGKRMVILVDGGQSTAVGASKNGLYQAIREHCPGVEDRIDIAICTHRDKDHAGGFPSFTRTWLSEGNTIGEFWLPGGWAGAVEYALTNPDHLVSLIHDGATTAANMVEKKEKELRISDLDGSEFRPTPIPYKSLSHKLHQLRHEGLRKFADDPSMAVLAEADDQFLEDDISQTDLAARSWGFSTEDWRCIQADLESSEIHVESLSSRMESYERTLFPRSIAVIEAPEYPKALLSFEGITPTPNVSLVRTLACNAIDTAEAIRSIASAAVNFDIPVRWFDFVAFENGTLPAGGIRGLLIPLNAVELKKVHREEGALALFLKLTLTEQNVASLVFQRVETSKEPGVIFLADSRLAFGVDSPERNFSNHLTSIERPIIYTAAHHGSRNNDHAYVVLESWLRDLYPSCLAVRNGGVWNQTLDGFLKIHQRRCAQCYQCHGGDWSQLVQINASGSEWSWPSDHGRACGKPRRKNR